MMKIVMLLVVLAVGLGPKLVFAGQIGEPAPPLLLKEWIKGQPVTIQPGTNIYVVEIWATTSLPSRSSIVTLDQIQKRFQTNGVVVVGVSDEPVEKIKDFVKQNGTNIEYAIAADDDHKTALSYMTPITQRGIPYAFVVGTNGTVLWHGSPLAGLNQVLERITSGKYDAARAGKAEVAARQMEQYLGLARRGDFRAKDAGLRLLANRTNDVELLCDLAYQIATVPRLPKRDLALAGEALDQAEQLQSTNKAPVMIIRAVWLFESGQQDTGMTLATQSLALAKSPTARTNIQYLVHTLEARLTAAKTSQTNNANTNQTNAVPVPSRNAPAGTNQSTAGSGNDSAVKP